MPKLSAFLRTGALALLPLAAAAQVSTAPALVEVKTNNAAPLTRLRLQATGGLYLGGDYDGGNHSGGIPAEGSGTRLVWYPEKAAFRAGYINGTQWDDANIGYFSVAQGYNARASGDYGVALGKDVVAANTSSVALGEFSTASGAGSVALGYYAHTNARQGSFVFADRSVSDDGNIFTDEAFRATTNHAAMWRVTGGFRVVTAGSGSSNGYAPSRGVSILPGTTTNQTTDWGQPSALIATSSGAYLTSGGSWTNSSDRARKHNFEPVAGEDVLARLRRVPITRWSYRADPATVRHLGPVAQDFRRAFGLGYDSVSISTVDADGVALAAAQALDARTRALQAENQQLRARLAALERLTAAPSSAGVSLPAVLLALGTSLLTALLLRRRPATC